ncbi:MAG: hypothetical protein JSV66_09175 [Trueperaceae bacterium]|nr:MAG: hypothetical protein JSV66_09175 [Trueperaceae bacterium]
MISELVTAIHGTPQLMVMNFAGAGVQALAWLHSVGGSSRTVLEATDRYTAPSLIEATGFEPKRFTSLRVAGALAEHAYARAGMLAEEEKVVFGLGCSATIATDRQKRGEHRCVVAVRDGFGVTGYELIMTKGARDRRGEEELVSLVILKAIADACGVLDDPDLPLLEREELIQTLKPLGIVKRFLDGERPWLLVRPDGQCLNEVVPENVALFSGAFHPLHQGHRRLAEVAATRLGREVFFELPLLNADKTPIGILEARRRAAQFVGVAPLLFTRSPLFIEKARLFPGCVFVVGADTAARVVDPRFYGDSRVEMTRALESLRELGVSFLVAGRQQGGRYVSLDDIGVPEAFKDLFEALSEEDFRLDVSSTEIRRGWV